MTRTTTCCVALLAAACIATSSAWAQGTSAQGAASASAATPIAAIPLSDVVGQAESAASTLSEIAADASPDPATQAIARDLPALTDEIDARLDETAQTVEGSTSLDKLRSFEADWRTLTKDLAPWRDRLGARARKLEDDLGRLGPLSERWQNTLEQLRGAQAPAEIRARAEAILASVGSAGRAIAVEQSRVLQLESRVAEQQRRADDAVKTIAARRDALVGHLLVQDGPPIWRAELWTQTGSRKNIRDSVRAQAQGLSAFAARNADLLIVHGVVFVFFAAALLYLRHRARPLVQANPQLAEPATVFELPVSTALILALLANSRIYPQTPQILSAIFGAIALVPAAIILRRLFARTLYPLLYALVVFFFIDQLRAIAEGAPPLTRPLFVLEMLGGFAFFVWFHATRLRREPPPEDMRRGHVYRIVRMGSLVVLPFFAIAVVANVLGYVNLSTLLGGGVLRSLYAAVVLYVVFRIFDAFVAFALRFRPLNLLHMARNRGPRIRHKLRRLALFGTRFTMQASFFPEIFRSRQIAIVVPNEAEQVYIHDKYMSELFVGTILQDTRERLVEIVHTMKEREQVDGLILGGTELSLILREPTAAGLPVLDTTQIHVEVAVEWLFRN